MAKKKDRTEEAPPPPEAGEDEGRTSPEATGVDPGVEFLGPEEVRLVFRKAAERDDLEARVVRLQADLDNFRRREQRERRQAAEEEGDRVLAPVFEALDTFARAVEAADSSRDVDALLEGVRLAVRELERGLAEVGVERIEGTGQALDPAQHRAIFQEPTEAHPPLTVLQVFSHGWRRGERVIRPAQVKVAAAPPHPDGAEGGANTEEN